MLTQTRDSRLARIPANNSPRARVPHRTTARSPEPPARCTSLGAFGRNIQNRAQGRTCWARRGEGTRRCASCGPATARVSISGAICRRRGRRRTRRLFDDSAFFLPQDRRPISHNTKPRSSTSAPRLGRGKVRNQSRVLHGTREGNARPKRAFRKRRFRKAKTSTWSRRSRGRRPGQGGAGFRSRYFHFLCFRFRESYPLNPGHFARCSVLLLGTPARYGSSVPFPWECEPSLTSFGC
mmetsp:Transcript_10456/g.34606  ORF Transcript_10456/g.34606 Transcript_10456/m.34606 type:complete len:238 (+) Transcript_10456:2684-3397(+)